MKDSRILSLLFVSMLGLTLLGTGIGQANAVDDGIVLKWIVAALQSKTDYGGNADDDATVGKVQDQTLIGDAWSRLQACRNAGQSLDLNLAAAEHYLFARTIASDQGDTDLRELPKKYANWKSYLQGKGFEQLLRTTSEPVSPVNDKVTAWGSKGIEAGLADYKARENKDPQSKSAAWKESFGVLYAIATRYLADSRPCVVSIQ
ncbi:MULTISPECIES: hypothetical protein [unclassified Mesorhizobium]|uniref:hypothetical protein n=1 Tax=unclassified Mesorhizobium TaxID=325217 RepID=UPI00112EACFC|nr:MULTISPECIES: hypothetical protein [unclassified Mesorhizobium]TPK66282.1 hypothetical protein FJ551_09285 [Mesorhizobium sp. B2-5-1]TPM60660.1 hypothetical protein FJ962_16140 [Mesorhizobium sp. B2-1-9]TPM88009.1 hypothetical protein FJ963_03405 [Mesorhizobium sp. B2-1-4]TPN11071.1 hypothetical protein FJ971_13305 [Mesorhizobium sp. B2-1-2]UCI14722.1 hypothetical protein FJ972_07640 [Mesorhizobium sp. B2-1-1]